jgi:hypothetical protein
MPEFCTYTTEISEDPVAVTRPEYEASGGLPEDWREYLWQEAESREQAVSNHQKQRHVEYTATKPSPNPTPTELEAAYERGVTNGFNEAIYEVKRGEIDPQTYQRRNLNLTIRRRNSQSPETL